MMMVMRSSAAATVVLVIVYLCHVTADDAPARSRPPGMSFYFLTRNCVRSEETEPWVGERDYTNKYTTKQGRFGLVRTPTLVIVRWCRFALKVRILSKFALKYAKYGCRM